MSVTIHQPYDKLAKYSLTDKKIAIDFLKKNLPAKIYARINIATLELTDKSFITSQFKSFHADIIYRCQIGGKEGFIFFLIEAESSAKDALIAFRKLQYIVGAMDQHLRQGHKKLPIILPICVYNGSISPYPYSCDVYDCFNNPEFAREIAFKPFILIDLTILSDEEIAQHGLAALMEMLLKHSRAKNFVTRLKKSLGLIKDSLSQFDKGYREFVIKYILNETQDEAPNALKQLIDTLNIIFPKEKNLIMTFAEQLQQQGMQQGMQQGEYRMQIAIAKKLIVQGESVQYIQGLTGLPENEVMDLVNTH